MKTLCMTLLMAVALGGHSSVLYAGQNGLLAKLKQSRSVSEGVAHLKRAVFRASAEGKLGKLTAAAFGLGMLLNVAAAPAEALTCLGCEQPPAPQKPLAAEQVDFRFSPLWHGNGGFPADGAPETLFSHHSVIVPNEWMKYFNFIINDIDHLNDGDTAYLSLNLPPAWRTWDVATDDIDGDGQLNAIAWYYNGGWQRITSWDNVGENNNGLSGKVDPAWFNMPGGGTWDGVQISVELTGGASYVFEGRSQDEQIDAGIRPTFADDDDSGQRSTVLRLEIKQGDGNPALPGARVDHHVHFHFRGFLPGDVYNDGFYSAHDLQYLQWRIWWNWTHFEQGPNGGKEHYLYDVDENGAINHADITKLQEILASGPWHGAAPSLLPARGGIAFSPPPGAERSIGENRQGTTIDPNARPSAVRPNGKAATTWGALKRQ